MQIHLTIGCGGMSQVKGSRFWYMLDAVSVLHMLARKPTGGYRMAANATCPPCSHARDSIRDVRVALRLDEVRRISFCHDGPPKHSC